MEPIPHYSLWTYFISLVLTGSCGAVAGFAIGWSVGIKRGVSIMRDHMQYFANLFQRLHSVAASTDQILAAIADGADVSAKATGVVNTE